MTHNPNLALTKEVTHYIFFLPIPVSLIEGVTRIYYASFYLATLLRITEYFSVFTIQ